MVVISIQFFSEEWRAGASCIVMSLLSCPSRQFIPEVFPYDLNGRSLYELMDVGNMVKFCGKNSCTLSDIIELSHPFWGNIPIYCPSAWCWQQSSLLSECTVRAKVQFFCHIVLWAS